MSPELLQYSSERLAPEPVLNPKPIPGFVEIHWHALFQMLPL